MAGQHRRTDKEPKQKKRKRWIWPTIGACVLLAGGVGYYELQRPLSGAESKYQVKPIHIKKTTQDAGRTNILLIGTDTRPGQTGGNTDVLILCSIDPKHKRIEMMSIPRDTKVELPNGTEGKINEALDLDGPQATVNIVSSLVHQPIDHYALTHFGGLVDIINTIHGITVDVPERMYYNTGDKQYNIINLKPGVQTLNGAQALGFVRFREDPLGDIGRTMRQQEFLTALAHKLLQPANIPQLPTLVHEFWGTIDTDMSLLDVLGLASDANQFKTFQIIHETLPGSFHNPDPSIPGDASYWIVNPAEAKWAAQQFFYDGVVKSNPIQDPSVTQNWTPPANPGANQTGNQTGNATAGGTGSGGASSNDTAPTTDGSGNSGGAGTQSPGTGNWVTVNASSVNIRSGPGTNYAIVGSAFQGQKIQVIATSGQWDEVPVQSGVTGYIANWLLTPTGSSDTSSSSNG